MYKLIGFLTFVTIVTANDLIVGLKDEGQKVFDEQRVANPAIWRQQANVTVSLNDTGVISRVVVTDLRPEKDGEAKIVEGGEGHKNITIELKSPTVFRGYDFHIVVYAVPEHDQQQVTQADATQQEVQKVPITFSGDTLDDNLRKTRKTGNDQSTTVNNLDTITTVPAFQVPKDLGIQKDENKADQINTQINTKDNRFDDISTPKGILFETTGSTHLVQHSEVTESSQQSQQRTDQFKSVIEDAPANDDGLQQTQQRNVRKSEISSVGTSSTTFTPKLDETTQVTTPGLSQQNHQKVDDLKPIQETTSHDVLQQTQQSSVGKPEISPVSTSSSTFAPKLDKTTQVTSTEADLTPTSSQVTIAEPSEALGVHKDVTFPRVIITEVPKVSEHKFQVPLPYKH